MAPFIVGAPRSGTTLLRLMLDAHPDLAIPPETGFVKRAALLRGFGRWALPPHRLHGLIATAPSWPDFHLDPENLRRAIATLPRYSPADGIRAFYRAYAARFGKPLWGDKTPTYGTCMRAIEGLLPEARFVHIMRDGRDVALSLRPLWFAPSRDMGELARYWTRVVRRTRRQARGVRHYLELRYEDLVREPEPALRTVCRFLELDFHVAMLSHSTRAAERLAEHEARFSRDLALLVGKAERLEQQRSAARPPDPGRIGRWRHALSACDVDAFERRGGALLDELGYPRADRLEAAGASRPASQPASRPRSAGVI